MFNLDKESINYSDKIIYILCLPITYFHTRNLIYITTYKFQNHTLIAATPVFKFPMAVQYLLADRNVSE